MTESDWSAPLRRVFRELRAPPPSSRVAAAMRGAEWDSEILIAWLQLAAVAIFFILYAATSAGFNAGPAPGPAPAALAVYGVVVALRLRLVYRRTLSAAARRLFDLADVAILMALIWSFTLQYDEPPALYLKAPTLFYAFGLIAIRALRFDARDVLATGLSVATGWGVLVLIAAQSAPVARDYPDYMTSLSIFWGAEAEKLFAIVGVTAILALRVARGRALLTRLTAEEAAAREFSRLVGPEASKRARGVDALRVGDGEVRPTAILFIDLRGFSALAAAMAPQDVIALLKEYHEQLAPVLTRCGGYVDKYLGDGILAVFVDRENGREAARALDAAAALVAAASSWAAARRARHLATPGVAIAVTHGDVVHGLVGYEDRLEFTVIGDAVNLAAKLEKHAKVEGAQVIATRGAFDAAARQGATHVALRKIAGASVDGAPHAIDLVILA